MITISSTRTEAFKVQIEKHPSLAHMRRKKETWYMVWYDINHDMETEWNAWMDKIHVPEVVAKGAFLGAKRFIVREGNAPGKYLNVYEAKNLASLRRYFEGAAKETREHYTKKYGDVTRITRAVLKGL